MKTIPAALQAHYDSGSTCMAYGLLLKREDGLEYGFTSHHEAFGLDATAWGFASSEIQMDAAQGLDFSAIVTTAGFQVDNMEITTLDDGSFFDRDEILAGAWRNAEFWIFRHRWDVDPVTVANDIEVMQRGWIGEVTLNQSTIRVELRGLTQKLQQPVGIVSTKTCRARLGSTTGINKCRVDLTDWTHTLEVTAVTDNRVFTSDALDSTFTDDYFGAGEVIWLTGDNAGAKHYVSAFTAGAFTLQLGTVLPIQVGDTFTAIAGCRKRLMEDCKAKFNNVLNFQGEPHRPTPDELLKPA